MHIAAASAPGATHINTGQPGKTNNQDALVVHRFGETTITVLCDGCGSQPHSATGADIGAYIIAQVIWQQLQRTSPSAALAWRDILGQTLQNLSAAVQPFVVSLNGSSKAAFEQAVIERFLFTAVVAVMRNDIAEIATFGDGVVILDDDVIVLDPPIVDTPPYLGYLLLNNSAYHSPDLREHLAFQEIKQINLRDLDKGLIVGTDGLKDLLHEDLHHPALVQPKALQRWLNVQTTERIHEGSFVGGKCRDDVSLVLVRTEEAQEKLLESRREVAELKQKISRLDLDICLLREDLKRTSVGKQAAEERLESLQTEFAVTAHQARKAELFEKELVTLRGRIASLRQDPDPPAGALSYAVDSFLQVFFPRSHPRIKLKLKKK